MTIARPSGADEAAAQPFAAKFPYLQYINWVSNHDSSNYNGLQLTLTQRAYPRAILPRRLHLFPCPRRFIVFFQPHHPNSWAADLWK